MSVRAPGAVRSATSPAKKLRNCDTVDRWKTPKLDTSIAEQSSRAGFELLRMICDSGRPCQLVCVYDACTGVTDTDVVELHGCRRVVVLVVVVVVVVARTRRAGFGRSCACDAAKCRSGDTSRFLARC